MMALKRRKSIVSGKDMELIKNMQSSIIVRSVARELASVRDYLHEPGIKGDSRRG